MFSGNSGGNSKWYCGQNGERKGTTTMNTNALHGPTYNPVTSRRVVHTVNKPQPATTLMEILDHSIPSRTPRGLANRLSCSVSSDATMSEVQSDVGSAITDNTGEVSMSSLFEMSRARQNPTRGITSLSKREAAHCRQRRIRLGGLPDGQVEHANRRNVARRGHNMHSTDHGSNTGTRTTNHNYSDDSDSRKHCNTITTAADNDANNVIRRSAPTNYNDTSSIFSPETSIFSISQSLNSNPIHSCSSSMVSESVRSCSATLMSKLVKHKDEQSRSKPVGTMAAAAAEQPMSKTAPNALTHTQSTELRQTQLPFRRVPASSTSDKEGCSVSDARTRSKKHGDGDGSDSSGSRSCMHEQPNIITTSNDSSRCSITKTKQDGRNALALERQVNISNNKTSTTYDSSRGSINVVKRSKDTNNVHARSSVSDAMKTSNSRNSSTCSLITSTSELRDITDASFLPKFEFTNLTSTYPLNVRANHQAAAAASASPSPATKLKTSPIVPVTVKSDRKLRLVIEGKRKPKTHTLTTSAEPPTASDPASSRQLSDAVAENAMKDATSLQTLSISSFPSLTRELKAQQQQVEQVEHQQQESKQRRPGRLQADRFKHSSKTLVSSRESVNGALRDSGAGVPPSRKPPQRLSHDAILGTQQSPRLRAAKGTEVAVARANEGTTNCSTTAASPATVVSTSSNLTAASTTTRVANTSREASHAKRSDSKQQPKEPQQSSLPARQLRQMWNSLNIDEVHPTMRVGRLTSTEQHTVTTRAPDSWTSGPNMDGVMTQSLILPHSTNVSATMNITSNNTASAGEASATTAPLPTCEAAFSVPIRTTTTTTTIASAEVEAVDAIANLISSEAALSASMTNRMYAVFDETTITKLERIGRGSYGSVYRAQENATGRILALKEVLIQRDFARDSEKQLLTLKREIMVMRKLHHRNIIAYYGASHTDYCLNIYMEYAGGGTMAKRYKQYGPCIEEECRYYTAQLLQGLEYLHQSNIVHRDLKGDNIYLTEDNTLKLGDFGTSKELVTSLVTDSVAGTPNFMAPEIISCSGHSYEADIWSVGCCVIEMLTGEPPMSKFDNPMAVMFGVMKGKLDEQIPDFISAGARSFIQACICMNAKERWTATQLRAHPWLCGGGDGEAADASLACDTKAAVVSSPPPPLPEEHESRVGNAKDIDLTRANIHAHSSNGSSNTNHCNHNLASHVADARHATVPHAVQNDLVNVGPERGARRCPASPRVSGNGVLTKSMCGTSGAVTRLARLPASSESVDEIILSNTHHSFAYEPLTATPLLVLASSSSSPTVSSSAMRVSLQRSAAKSVEDALLVHQVKKDGHVRRRVLDEHSGESIHSRAHSSAVCAEGSGRNGSHNVAMGETSHDSSKAFATTDNGVVMNSGNCRMSTSNSKNASQTQGDGKHDAVNVDDDAASAEGHLTPMQPSGAMNTAYTKSKDHERRYPAHRGSGSGGGSPQPPNMVAETARRRSSSSTTSNTRFSLARSTRSSNDTKRGIQSHRSQSKEAGGCTLEKKQQRQQRSSDRLCAPSYLSPPPQQPLQMPNNKQQHQQQPLQPTLTNPLSLSSTTSAVLEHPVPLHTTTNNSEPACASSLPQTSLGGIAGLASLATPTLPSLALASSSGGGVMREMPAVTQLKMPDCFTPAQDGLGGGNGSTPSSRNSSKVPTPASRKNASKQHHLGSQPMLQIAQHLPQHHSTSSLSLLSNHNKLTAAGSSVTEATTSSEMNAITNTAPTVTTSSLTSASLTTTVRAAHEESGRLLLNHRLSNSIGQEESVDAVTLGFDGRHVGGRSHCPGSLHANGMNALNTVNASGGSRNSSSTCGTHIVRHGSHSNNNHYHLGSDLHPYSSGLVNNCPYSSISSNNNNNNSNNNQRDVGLRVCRNLVGGVGTDPRASVDDVTLVEHSIDDGGTIDDDDWNENGCHVGEKQRQRLKHSCLPRESDVAPMGEVNRSRDTLLGGCDVVCRTNEGAPHALLTSRAARDAVEDVSKHARKFLRTRQVPTRSSVARRLSRSWINPLVNSDSTQANPTSPCSTVDHTPVPATSSTSPSTVESVQDSASRLAGNKAKPGDTTISPVTTFNAPQTERKKGSWNASVHATSASSDAPLRVPANNHGRRLPFLTVSNPPAGGKAHEM